MVRGIRGQAQKHFTEALVIAVPLSESFPNHEEYRGLADYFKNRLKALPETAEAGDTKEK